MTAKHVLAAAAVIFVVAALVRITRDSAVTAQSRAWLTVAVIFALVSAWLWWRQ